jgi:hypothetical protein
LRYIEVTHTYVIPVPADAQDVIEPIAREGMSIMERFIQDRAANMRNLHSDWKLLPKEYRPVQPVQGEDTITYEPASVPSGFTDTPSERDRIESLAMIEADADPGISFTRDVMGQTPGPPPHPWQQGLRVLPVDHDLFDAETEALRQEGMLCGELSAAKDYECVCVVGHAGIHVWRPRRKTEEIEA